MEARENHCFFRSVFRLNSHLCILLERADGAEALLAQAKRLERGALEAQKVPRRLRQRKRRNDHREWFVMSVKGKKKKSLPRLSFSTAFHFFLSRLL